MKTNYSYSLTQKKDAKPLYSIYSIFFKDKNTNELIAFTDSAEKADFIVKAANDFKEWNPVVTEPKIGGEYNVVYDLKDGGEPLVTTMEFYFPEKKWHDTGGAGDVCDTVLFWKDLPDAPSKP